MTLWSDARATISSSNSSSMARICHISRFSCMLFKALTFKLLFIRSASTLEVWRTKVWLPNGPHSHHPPATHVFVGKGWIGSYINSHTSTSICTYCTSFFNIAHTLWNSYEVASKYLLQGWMCCAPSDCFLLVKPAVVWVPVAFQWSPTINSPHSDLWQQQGIFLHATAVHWVHAHPSLWAFSGGRDVVKLSVDKQQFVKHQQPHSPPLKSLRSSFFSVMTLSSIFNDSNSPHSLVYSCCQRICLLALCVNKQLSIVPNNMCISLMVIPLVF